jgi:hypothetical protein
MNLRPLVARALKVLPAVVIVVAALFQARTFGGIVRSQPAPDAVTMLARSEVRGLHDVRRGRALESTGTRTRRELDALQLGVRAVR